VSISPGNREIEIKLRAPSPESASELLLTSGFSIQCERLHETNVLYDTAARQLRETGEMLRLREAGQRSILTFKGAGISGRHKSREELELELSSARTFEQILNRLGFEPTFRYEKYRTEFGREGSPGTVTLDETPIGTFLELEGDPQWIDDTAASLGFREEDYITASYGRLYLEWCTVHQHHLGDMTWTAVAAAEASL
jgi:adenylate cyclase class 2